jgi:hypothetical protein
MVDDVYVWEDGGWYVLVAQVGGYLLVYFFVWSDVTPGSTRGYSVDLLLYRTGIFTLKFNILALKLYNSPVPEGY